MEILILKNNEIFARATATEGTAADYELVVIESIPEYPTTKPVKGKEWELVYNNGAVSWELVNRELTAEERLLDLEDRINAIEYPEFVQPTGAHDCYNTGDKVTYNGKRYISLIDANTWDPEAYPDGWEVVR